MSKIKNHFNYRVTKDPLDLVPIEIIIPFHGQTQLVAKLIDSIFKNVRDTKYVITLVDDASPNSDFLSSLLKAKIPNFRGLRNFKHSGFGYSVNQALRSPFSSQVSWIVIMHSDTEVQQPSCLLNLKKTLHSMKEQNVKMVTSLTNNPTNNLIRLKAEKNISSDSFILEENEFIPMYCCIAHRELFSRVGPLLECPYAGTEAEEFGLRMKKFGYLQGASGNSWIHHAGGASLQQFRKNTKVQDILKETKNKVFFT